ncbi:ArsR/SmtB family transcription factor [Microtetraspora fusca]|uniref:ArsR/SmtB family transcription factor n=1 Tax=Microtetraspora fusca TaxID=1997 RepID=UPI000834AC61|nr:metalloregulator ArsR/SmtB family transcription factor [Microtetraspora fusca]
MGEDVFKALADLTRRRILDELAERDGRALAEICAWLMTKHGLRLSRQAISQHLAVLREAGLVVVRMDGKQRVYALRPEPLTKVDQWLEPYRMFWSKRLDALEQHLEENP